MMNGQKKSNDAKGTDYGRKTTKYVSLVLGGAAIKNTTQGTLRFRYHPKMRVFSIFSPSSKMQYLKVRSQYGVLNCFVQSVKSLCGARKLC